MMVGEQPGTDEDLAGHPFVGPAGKLLDRALAEAGIDRRRVWEPKGKRRIHAKPSAGEIGACRPWLEAELEVVRPEVLVMATVHPSSILRAPDDESRRAEMARLVADLRKVAAVIGRRAAA